MILVSAYADFYNDKIIEHARLGTVSCSGLMNNYENCDKLLKEYKWRQTCSYFKDLTMQCYKLSVNEFTEFIDDAIEERRRLRAVVEVIKQLLGRHKSILLQYREQNSTPHLFDSLDGEKLVFQGMYSEKKQKSRS